MKSKTQSTLYSVPEVENSIEITELKLLTKERFYGSFLSSFNKSLDIDQPEVTGMKPLDSMNVSLSINPTLWMELDSLDRVNKLKHELLHLIFLHPWKKSKESNPLFYTACDIEVSDYVEDRLSLKESNFRYLCNEYQSTTGFNKALGCESIYSDLTKLLPKIRLGMRARCESLEEWESIVEIETQKALRGDIYLPNSDQLSETIAFFPDPSGNGEQNISGIHSLIKTTEPGDLQEAIESYINSNQGNWNLMKDKLPEDIAEAIVSGLLSAAKSRGEVPGNLSDYVDVFLADPLVDWRSVLRKFTRFSGVTDCVRTMTRRSKRWGTFPAVKITNMQRIAIVIDTSGSMSDEEFNQAINEVRGSLAERCQVIVIQADAVVDSVDIYTRKLPNISRIERNGYGGTSFDDALLYVKTKGRLDQHSEFPNIDKVDGVVYITDGYAPAPEESSYPNCKVIWVSTQKEVQDYVSEGFRGHVIKINI